MTTSDEERATSVSGPMDGPPETHARVKYQGDGRVEQGPVLSSAQVIRLTLCTGFVARHRLVLGVLVFITMVVGAACGGGRTPLLPGLDQAPGVPGAAGGGGLRTGSGGVGAATGASFPTQFTPTEVQAALAGCDLPHGPPVNLDTADQEAAHLVGSWIVCPAPPNAAEQTMFGPAIQFRPDGSFTTLVRTDDGGLQLGTGLERQGKWSAFCEMSSTIKNSEPCHGGGVYYYSTIYVWVHLASGNDNRASCAVGPIAFETSPTRAYVVDYPGWCDADEGGGTLDFWMVPLP